ncbi:MAG: succinate dehydrogenase assembly factor 2 [Burkholderiales bacterium]|mgnify:CR=1 FL=1|nr:succinate dehydrogenase assembly factor 2 [Burkholderiales bacterium]
MSEMNRLRWKCRRGMLELDLVLNQFLEQDYSTLDADAKQAFVTLLEAGDEELWALITDEAAGAAPELQTVINRLRTC